MNKAHKHHGEGETGREREREKGREILGFRGGVGCSLISDKAICVLLFLSWSDCDYKVKWSNFRAYGHERLRF